MLDDVLVPGKGLKELSFLGKKKSRILCKILNLSLGLIVYLV